VEKLFFLDAIRLWKEDVRTHKGGLASVFIRGEVQVEGGCWVHFSTLRPQDKMYLQKDGKVTNKPYGNTFIGYYNGWSGVPDIARIRLHA
jgi:hypothetical protein